MTITTILMNKHSPLVTVKPYTRVDVIIELMKKNDVGSVAVVNDSGVFEGLVTEKDLLKAIDAPRSVLQPLLAKEILSSRVLTCSLDDSESSIMERMVDAGVQYMPVVNEGETIAIVSMTDLAQARIGKIRSLMKEITDTIHIEKQLEYFTRHLKPLRANGSFMARERRPG